MAAPEIAIPPDILRNWQRIVDLLAGIMHVPSAVVTMLEPPSGDRYRTVASSDSEGNPFPVDQVFAMDIGTFCETVIKNREPLLVANALDDVAWQSAPELATGMVSYLGFPVSWPDGRVFGTICVLDCRENRYSDIYQELLLHCRDVLQGDLQTLARLSGELEEQKARLSELFERVPEAVVLADHDARITRVNPEFTKIFGYRADEAVGRRIQQLIAPDQPEAEGEDSLLSRVVRTGEVLAAETVRRHRNGTPVPVSLLCVPVSSGGRERSAYLIYRDLTETKRLQDEERRYHEVQLELAHANRVATIGLLSASIAHEINQPLTGIITNSSTCLRMLTGDPPNLEGARETVRRTIRDGNRASEVVTRLRALFSRKEAATEAVDLNESILEVIALSQAELQRSRVVVQMALAAGLPPVAGDRIQLQQVVLNLLVNARDAMKDVEGRPRLVLISTAAREPDSVCVSIRDSGVGFGPQAAEKVFEAFYTTKTDSMGMGLSVSRSIIDSHQGRLWATPNDGPGATFSFSVPCRTNTRVQ